mmetsp:Transcript_9348/g.24171  ORF Transcript_9348/g.24171 Transcript_9348/m.24171 type:complete len:223 (-) Transcript_9348:306-974(-)
MRQLGHEHGVVARGHVSQVDGARDGESPAMHVVEEGECEEREQERWHRVRGEHLPTGVHAPLPERRDHGQDLKPTLSRLECARCKRSSKLAREGGDLVVHAARRPWLDRSDGVAVLFLPFLAPLVVRPLGLFTPLILIVAQLVVLSASLLEPLVQVIHRLVGTDVWWHQAPLIAIAIEGYEVLLDTGRPMSTQLERLVPDVLGECAAGAAGQTARAGEDAHV